MDNNKQFLQEIFNEILEQINKKLEEKSNIEILSNKYKEVLIKLDQIFNEEKEKNREKLEPDSFDFLRSIVFMKGSHEFHEKLNGIMGFYIYNYRIQPEFKKYVNYEDIENDIRDIIYSEIDLLDKEIATKFSLIENKELLEELVNILNQNKYVGIETSKLFNVINEFKEVNSEYKTNILMNLIDYNNNVINGNNNTKEKEIIVPQVTVESVKSEIREQKEEKNIELVVSSDEEEKKKVKSVRNVKKKTETRKKKETKKEEAKENVIEEVITKDIEEIEFLDEEEIILSSQAKAIYDTIDSMISTMPMEDVISYIKDTAIWGNLYLEEIKLYCSKKSKAKTDKLILEIFKNISTKEEFLGKMGDGIIIFKGYDNTTSLIEKDLSSIRDSSHLESVKIYLEELKNKEVNFVLDAFHSDGELKGSYHKKSRKAVRLCYDILGNGIYYVYDLTVKKSDNDKASKTKMMNRRPNEYEVKMIKDLLENETSRQEIIEKNEQIYNNIISYIEEEVPELKNPSISR